MGHQVAAQADMLPSSGTLGAVLRSYFGSSRASPLGRAILVCLSSHTTRTLHLSLQMDVQVVNIAISLQPYNKTQDGRETMFRMGAIW